MVRQRLSVRPVSLLKDQVVNPEPLLSIKRSAAGHGTRLRAVFASTSEFSSGGRPFLGIDCFVAASNLSFRYFLGGSSPIFSSTGSAVGEARYAMSCFASAWFFDRMSTAAEKRVRYST